MKSNEEKESKQYFQGMVDEEINSYKWKFYRRYIQVVIVLIGGFILPLSLIGFALGWRIVFSQLTFMLWSGVYLYLSYKYILPRLIRNTGATEIAILDNPLISIYHKFRIKKEVDIPTEEVPIPGLLAVRPGTLYPTYIWEGEKEVLDMNTEVVISSNTLPQEQQTYYTGDIEPGSEGENKPKKLNPQTVLVYFQINVRILENSMKYVTNLVRYPKESRFATVKEQVISYVVPKLREWFSKHTYDEINIKKLEEELFNDIFHGKELHPLEKKLGIWTGEPRIISFVLAPSLQKGQENVTLMNQVTRMAKEAFELDPQTSYAVHYTTIAASMGLQTGDAVRQIYIKGDAGLIDKFGNQVQQELSRGGNRGKGNKQGGKNE